MEQRCLSALSISIALLLLESRGLLQAQAQQNKSLDPVELQALRIFATKLGLGSQWDFNVDPCFGSWNNVNGSSNFLPTAGIECDCSLDFCHVTKIAVVSINVQGQIAPEIGNFSYLTDLNLGQNAITGTLPEEIGLLSRLTGFNVAINKLTGPIPRSIGRLSKLFTMGFGSNYFTGTIPREIGNMTFLLKLYMDACGLGGELPVELGNLTSLELLWMAYNDFNGTVPEFFGRMTGLQDLKMFGNKFQGPIPPSIGNLPLLKSLDLGDVSSGVAIPTSFSRLRSLTKLSLRNCGLSGSIPDLRNMSSLTYLDLSFNNLSGQIPASLGQLASLATLFLANNSLAGVLPLEPGSFQNLTQLDVSYNNLSGAVPAWLNSSSLQSNIIWNHFNVNQTFRAKDACVQGRVNCSGRNVQFAINCGGAEYKSTKTIIFSDDSRELAGGTSYLNSTQPWGVSSAGHSDGFQSIYQTTRPITSATDPALCQTARSAPTSLKYLGIGMVNGPYTLQLHFAEIVIDNSSGWTGIARRVFDVYVQGSRVLKDFNIQNEAGGSYRALVKTFPVNVSNDILQVELLWRGRGTCCHGPLISAIQVIPGFNTDSFIQSTKLSNRNNSVKVGIAVGVSVAVLALVTFPAIFLVWRRRKGKSDIQKELINFEGKPTMFSYNQMKAATRGFASENKLGEGGFGAVFKGVLPDGTTVAVKQLSSKSSQGTTEFLNEVMIISAVQHRNLVKLQGCCIEGNNQILVYEYLENNSLHQALFRDPKLHLDWPTRFNICLGIARGIAYLHEESLPRIVHRDIKASNVLLDKALNPKIADFGLAKLFKEDHHSHVSTRVAGTIGYLAPEYAMRGQLTEKADIYSFGVLVLEIVSGRTNLGMALPEEMVYLLEWTWHLYEKGRVLELLDKDIDEASEEQVVRVIKVALLCSQAVPSSRPRMSHVVAMLVGTAPVDSSTLRPGYFTVLKELLPPVASDTSERAAAASSDQTPTSSGPSTTLVTDTSEDSFMVHGR